MDIDYTKIYQNINFSFKFAGGLLKILVGLILFAILFYSFMLMLKIRVLQDTVEVSPAGFAKTILAINLLVTLIGSLLAFILILL
jgi:hypothetical protein